MALGFDNFSVRAFGWNADQLIDYAAEIKVDYLMTSDLGVFESFEEPYLKGLRQKADGLGIKLIAGTTSICPTSASFKDRYGTAEEHLALTIRVAHALGSSAARCYLGNLNDRMTEGGIEPHIDATVAVCKSVRELAVETGVKIAIENHAGDLQAWELAMLVEKAGPDYVGVTLDSGNAAWTIEDPTRSLEILAPYAATSGIRDSAIWETENGANVQWTNMGDGCVDWTHYFDRYQELCGTIPVILEIISGGPREMDYYAPGFWDRYPKGRAADFAAFTNLARKGQAPVPPAGRPEGSTPEETAKLQQKFDLEESLRYCREKLGLGIREA